jgi:hypothetical protein
MIEATFKAPDRAAVWRTVRTNGGTVLAERFQEDRITYSLWAVGVTVDTIQQALKTDCRHSFTVAPGSPPVHSQGGGTIGAGQPVESGYGG